MAKGKQSIKQQLRTLTDGREGFGRSKHDDKLKDKYYIASAGDDFDKTQLLEKHFFYTRTTLNDCLATARNFVKWVNTETDLGGGRRLADVKEYGNFIENYINYLVEDTEKTPRTIAKVRSQLGKVWLVDTDGIAIPRCRTESMKGRQADPHYNMSSPEHAAATKFYCATGARKNEYRMLNLNEQKKYIEQAKTQYGIDIKTRDGMCPNVYPVIGESGLVEKVLVLHAKHGKSNLSEILPEHREMVTNVYRGRNDKGQTKYIDMCKPADHCNVHACRRQYAQNLYKAFARDVTTLSAKDVYSTRDGTGRHYDKAALERVSESLGHRKNDLFDTVHNYMR